MELDKTTIVLRQRAMADIIDLSLVVMKTYWKPLIAYAAIGVLPFLLLNYVILRPLTDYDTMLLYDSYAIDELPFRIRYIAYLCAFVFLQSPIAMLGVTYYLGNTLFLTPTSFRDLRKSVFRMLLGFVVILGLLRLGFLAWLTVLLMPTTLQVDPFLEVFWLGVVLCGTVVAIRAFRPFAPEILMLEQSPLRSKAKANQQSSVAYRQRSKNLHQELSGELMIRSIIIFVVIAMMLSAITLCELFLGGIFAGVWTWEWWMDTILFPLNLWLVALWGTVIRFLSYLDCRTRLEGWELDLRLRAEARRLTGEFVR